MAKRDQPPAGKAQRAPALLNLQEIKELIELVTEKGVSEFELERAGVRIRIVRGALSHQAESAIALPQAPSSAREFSSSSLAEQPALSAAGSGSAGNDPGVGHVGEARNIVRSPMVGTFYASPSPDAGPFVRVGDKVEAGQVLCIIEAMKLMNEIEAETAGEITRCYIENGQPVEYGEPLFDLHPR